jgi:hypothetical protein
MLFPNQPAAAIVGAHCLEAACRRRTCMVDMARACIEFGDEVAQVRQGDASLPVTNTLAQAGLGALDKPARAPQYPISAPRLLIRCHLYLIADISVSNILLTAVMTCAEAE